MNKNKYLQQAKTSKKDEFYTQLTDIEKELKHYKQHFKDKVVYCNCDDPRVSSFFHYFSYNFEKLGLKKLITTCYKNQNLDLFSQNNSERAVYLEYVGDKNQNKLPEKEEIKVNYLKGDGDFRSKECIELLKLSDIVVTNPPFSLFREYVSQLVEYNKKFLIIGNLNAITYKEIFNLFKTNKIWFGYNSVKRFTMPENYIHNSVIVEKGVNYAIFGNICWYSNLDIAKRHENMILYKTYNPSEYPKYDNYDAIEVSKTKDIPMDFEGVMGVPITFLDKYNPDQFEIIGATESEGKGFSNGLWDEKSKITQPLINQKRAYKRIFIKNKKVIK